MKHEILNHKIKEYVRKVPLTFEPQENVQDAIERLRKMYKRDGHVVYFYVLDRDGVLQGVLSIRDLLFAELSAPLESIMYKKVYTLQGSQTLKEALSALHDMHFLALPVVEERKFLGIIDVQTFFDDVVEIDNEHKRFEAFQTMGIFLEDRINEESTRKKFIRRFPWLICNMIGGILCAIISGYYRSLLLQFIVLAMFIPLVLSLSESVSMQSMTQSIHHILRRPHFGKILPRYLLHELKLFILIALTSGIIIGVLSSFWRDGWSVGFPIGIGIIVSVTVSAVLGVLIPFLVHLGKLDPKVASGPIVLMIADVITTLIYFVVASFLLI